MSLQQFFGHREEQARTIDASGAWCRWTRAQPVLAQVGSAVDLCQVVTDRAEPAAANDLLMALVRVGSVDGGVDETAATFVAALLAPGGDRIIRSLSSLGPDIDAMVAGQLWLQVRAYPWRCRPRAVAKNTLMETRRAVLADYGATTAGRAALVPLAPPELIEAVDRCGADVSDQLVADLALLELLAWARARGVLERGHAALLWELVMAACDEETALVPSSLARGVGSKQSVRVAAARGVTARTVSRQRAHAVAQLRLARADFEIGDGSHVHPQGVAVLTGIGRHIFPEGRNR